MTRRSQSAKSGDRDAAKSTPHLSRDRRNALLLALLVLLVFSDILFLGRGFYKEDVAGYHWPMKKVVRDVTFAGGFPYWNPSWEGGQPLAANPAYELFYPLQWLIYLPNYSFWFQFHILIHIVLAAVGMYALLRSFDLREMSAAFGAIVFAHGGPFLSLIVRMPLLFSLAWTPLILLFARRLVLYRRRADLVWTALLVGMQALVGEPTGLFQTIALCGGYALYRLARDRAARSTGIAAGLLAIAFVSGLLVAAVQLGPGFDHAADSVRAEGIEWKNASSWTTPPARSVELLFPQLFRALPGPDGTPRLRSLYPLRVRPFLTDIYLGVIPLLLAIAGLFSRFRGRVLVLLLVAAFALIAFGPLFRMFYQLGIFRSIRYPEKFLLAALLVLVIWAARVFDAAIGGDRSVVRTVLILASLWTAAAVIAMGNRPTGAPVIAGASEEATPLPWRSYWGFNIARGVVAISLVSQMRRHPKIAGLGVILFTLADFSFLHTSSAARITRKYFEEPPVVKTLPADRANYRIFHKAAWDDWEGVAPPVHLEMTSEWFSRNGMLPFFGTAYGFRGVLEDDMDQTGLHASTRLLRAAREAKRLSGSWPPFFLSASNVTQVAEFTAEDPGPVTFLSVPPTPRYYFAERLIQVSSDAEVVSAAASNGAGLRDAFVSFASFSPASAEVRSVHERPGFARIEVTATGPAFLVASNTYHRYWRAVLDGQPVDLDPTNIGYAGVRLPAGNHVVELRYRNPLVLWFGLVSIATIAGLALIRQGDRGHPSPGR